MHKKILTAFLLAMFISPALIPSNASAAEAPDIAAPAYVARDVATGKIIYSKNANARIPAASLTKVMTALVVADTKPNLNKVVTITKSDQVIGACGRGGGCLKTVPGTKYTLNDLFFAALLPSANNAAAAIARSTGLSTKAFVARMNAKAKVLGATSTRFVEPTGMSYVNLITAADYSKIMAAAFGVGYLSNIEKEATHRVVALNNSRYTSTVRNSDKLLGNADLTVAGAKTGYLKKYNFGAVLQYNGGRKLAIVVLNEQHMYSAYDDTRILAASTQQELSSVAVK